MIKNLFFDLYQTLVDVDIEEKNKPIAWKVFESFLISNSIPTREAAKFKIYFDSLEEEYYSNKNIAIEHHDWIENLNEVFSQKYNLKLDNNTLKLLINEFRKVSISHVRLYPNAKNVLNILSKDYNIYLASLAHASITIPEIETLEINKYFINMFFTSELKIKKSENFYKKILELTQSEPSQSIMIGDNKKEDIFFAQKTGMKTIWIKNTISKNNDFKCNADAFVPIEKIQTLPEIIKNLNI